MRQSVLVLTAAPGSKALDDRLVADLRGHVAGAARESGRWLADGEAWEMPLTDPEDADAKAAARATVGDRPIDVNVVAGDGERRKALLVADMEATIIEQECLDELAEFAGQRDRIAAVTKRAMRGEIDFAVALRERVHLLAGLDIRVLEEVYARVTLTPGAATLVATMRRHGAVCALVSGGFTFFAARIAARLGFSTHQANTLEIVGTKLAGTVGEPILGSEAKRAALERLRVEAGLPQTGTLAVGDGANDLGMMAAAGLGVAFRAKPVVAAQARVSIVHADLTALLHLQGYAGDELVTEWHPPASGTPDK